MIFVKLEKCVGIHYFMNYQILCENKEIDFRPIQIKCKRDDPSQDKQKCYTKTQTPNQNTFMTSNP